MNGYRVHPVFEVMMELLVEVICCVMDRDIRWIRYFIRIHYWRGSRLIHSPSNGVDASGLGIWINSNEVGLELGIRPRRVARQVKEDIYVMEVVM